MTRLATIEISKEYLHFSAAHFTIFSATERERLHGHNFHVSAKVTAPVGDNGLCFDYQLVKDELRRLCVSLDEYTLIPQKSAHLLIEEKTQHYRIGFNGEQMTLPKMDVKLLPLANISVEELSDYFLGQLLGEGSVFNSLDLFSLEIGVASGSRQWSFSRWEKGEL